jgi:hypothetical protein
MDFEENRLFDKYLSDWYMFYTELYTNPYPNYRYNYGLTALFDKILDDRRKLKQNQEILTFHKLTQKSNKWLIGSIVLDNLIVGNQSNENRYIQNYRNDIEHMMYIVRNSVHIMEYLIKKYDFVYVDYWRNKEVIMNYVNDSYRLEQFALNKFTNAGTTNDLLEGYDSITKIAYNGLIITTYIKFLNEDCLKQSYYIQPIHINNISQEFFELSRHEIRELDRLNEQYYNDNEEDYEDDYDDEYSDYED